jgi:flagellar hook protein FlgE
MGLTSALNTSVNALSLNETAMAVIGNNIANADTNGFKASDVLFSTQLSQTLSIGSAPTATNGGTNPQQIGLGSEISAIQTNFTQGSLTDTSIPSDLAIQGNGFFVLNSSQGQVYTRDGDFTLSSSNQLVNAQGDAVQGYAIDNDFNLVTSQLQNLTIPLGELNVAQQTSQVTMNGALLPTGQVATQGAHILSDTLGDAGNAGADATSSTLLTNLEDPPGTSLGIQVGDVLGFTPQVGGVTLPAQNLTVTATTTLGDLTSLMDGALGIQSGNGVPNDPNELPAAGQPGVNVVNGQIQITGDMGTDNNITMAVGDLTNNGAALSVNFNQNEQANGESATTNFVVYDSLGTPLTVSMTAVLQSTAPDATTYRYFFNSEDNDGGSTGLGTGTITFNSTGQVVDGGTGNFSINRSDTAAVSPMVVSVNMSGISGISTTTAGSTLSMATQNGSAPGTLSSYTIASDGVINGVFSNGDTRTLGQVMLATFSNQQGLVENGNGTFTAGVSAGPAQIAAPNSSGAGSLQAGEVEASNTDIGTSLVQLITVSTNYQGDARVISVADELINDLLTLAQQTT